MPVESATYISQLDPANPAVTDPIATLYEHDNLIKQVLQDQFPNLGTVAVSATAAQLNASSSALSSGVFSIPSNGTVASGELDILGLTNAGGTIVAGRVELKNTATSGAAGGLSIVMTNTADASPATVLTLSAAGALAATASLNAPSVLKGGHELIPVGCILLWSGSVASIPAGWALCDGTNGTPNLVGKFVAGAGTSPTPGTNGGSFTATGTADAQGSHSHSGSTIVSGAHSHGTATGAWTLTTADTPSHTHTATATSGDSGHAHTFPQQGLGADANGIASSSASVPTGGGTTATGFANIVTTVTVAATGGGGPHAHSIGVDGNHVHLISADGTHVHNVSVIATPPYYALAYIMKTT